MKAKKQTFKSKKKTQTQWDIFWAPLSVPMSKFFGQLEKRESNKTITGAILLLAACIPFVVWLLGASANPSGWMSKEPLTTYSYIGLLVWHYWYIALPIYFALVFLIMGVKMTKSFRARLWACVVFIATFVVSLFVYPIIESANESEFTG